jgi:hypothetical protein
MVKEELRGKASGMLMTTQGGEKWFLCIEATAFLLRVCNKSNVTQRVPHMEQELLTLLESFLPIFSRNDVAWFLVFLSISFLPLYCLSFGIRFRITPVVFSNFC